MLPDVPDPENSASVLASAPVVAALASAPVVEMSPVSLAGASVPSGSLASAISPDKSAVPPALVSANALQPLLATVIDITSINTDILRITLFIK